MRPPTDRRSSGEPEARRALALGIHRDPKPSDPTDDPGVQSPEYVGGLEDSLGGRGLVVGEPPSSWPGRRLLPPIDQRLHDARHAIVIISKAFLASSSSRKVLDDLTTRSGVVAILADIIEADVAGRSPGLAVAASPGSPSERLVCLLRAGEETGSFEFSLTRRRPRSHADIADSGDESTLCGRDTLRQRRWSPLP